MNIQSLTSEQHAAIDGLLDAITAPGTRGTLVNLMQQARGVVVQNRIEKILSAIADCEKADLFPSGH